MNTLKLAGTLDSLKFLSKEIKPALARVNRLILLKIKNGEAK